MGELHYFPFEEERTDIKDRVIEYWTDRADSFYRIRRDEIESQKAELWTREIKNALVRAGLLGDSDGEEIRKAEGPAEKLRKSKRQEPRLKVLDLGCGAGFFEVLLGRLGYDLTGIDLTEEMIEKAERMLDFYLPKEAPVRVMTGDAEKLDFSDESFDLIITRNLTWTLPHPIQAYAEWYRLLKKGGLLLNFDAEYAKGAHNLKSPENIAHKDIPDEMKDRCHAIYHMLTISALDRPEWDEEVLRQVGFVDVATDRNFYQRVLKERDEFYMPDRMFMIEAKK